MLRDYFNNKIPQNEEPFKYKQQKQVDIHEGISQLSENHIFMLTFTLYTTSTPHKMVIKINIDLQATKINNILILFTFDRYDIHTGNSAFRVLFCANIKQKILVSICRPNKSTFTTRYCDKSDTRLKKQQINTDVYVLYNMKINAK